MDIKKYQDKLKELKPTAMQQKVIDADLSLSVTAGAGSGKTKVLLDKIIKILSEKDLDIDNLVIVTFTNKATSEMKKRLGKRLYYQWLQCELEEETNNIKNKDFWRKQVELIEMANISTIHKFCEQIIRKYGLEINQAVNFSIQSVKNFANSKLRQLIDEYSQLEELSDIKNYKLQKFVYAFYQNNKNKGLEVDYKLTRNMDLSNKKGTEWIKITDIFIKIYNKFLKELAEYKKDNNILTENDLIKYAVKILQKSDYALTQLNKKYKVMFIDEFQDTNRYQYQLVEKLKKAGMEIFVVGDEKQSIYRFRGADVQTYIEMNKTGEVIDKQKYLLDNFRTDKQLLQVINLIFKHDFKDEQGKILKIDSKEKFKGLKAQKIKGDSSKYDKSFLRVSFSTQLKEVIHYLRDIDNIKYDDISILFRSNWDLNQAAKELKGTDIPIEVIGGKGFFNSKSIIDVFKLLNHLFYADYITKKELAYTDFYQSYRMYRSGDFYIDFIEKLINQARILSVDSLLEYIYSQCQIEKFYIQKKMLQEISNLMKLKDMSMNLRGKDFKQAIEFCNYLERMIDTEKEEEEGEVSDILKDNYGVVSLISIHKAKGLESPVIILPKINKNLLRKSIDKNIILDYKFNKKSKIGFKAEELYDEFDYRYIKEKKDPDYRELNKKDKNARLEEELRILYVALTRAENMLILLGDKKPMEDEICWANWLKGVNIQGKNLLGKYKFDFNLLKF